ncbi:phage tail protein [Escherichia coli]|nr:phage tail protein [Escherichia coli]
MKVRAHQYDTVDALCWRHYGRTQGVTEQVLKANPGLAEYGPFLPHGLQVELPDIPTTTTVQTVQLWDPNFATTMLNALAGKQPLDNTLTHLSGKDVAGLLAYLGLGEGAPAIGVPFFWPSAAMPNSVIDSWSGMVFLKFNGAKFSATDYPVLAKVFPSLVLPEARGDFIRIWDDGRGADGGRELLSWQAATNFSQFAGNIGEGAGHAINFHDGIAGNQPGFSRFNFTSNSVGDGVNFVAVRPRNIAFNFLVRAK